MRNVNDPRQSKLFDPFEAILSPVAYRRIRNGWQGVFRHVILELMPVDVIAGHFSADMGAPTKELYSMAGLVLIKEFKDWTTTEAAEAYMFNNDVQYALNLEPSQQSLSERTIERYEKIFVENNLASTVMHDVTVTLAKELELDVSRQRLDSTHVFSDMALFGRTRLMGVAIKRLLTQLKRHDRQAWEALPEGFRARYEPAAAMLFGDVARDRKSRRTLRQEVAEQMYWLIERFADDQSVSARTTYKDLLKVFEQQCEVVEQKVQVKAHPGGDVIQNPSDRDATRDGHKGPGYQVQTCESCSESNEVQLITSAIPQTAAEEDGESLPEVIDDLERKELRPEALYADARYGSDENVRLCGEKGIDLQSPVSGRGGEDTDALNIDDFVVDEQTEKVERCPAGQEPVRSEHDAETGKTTTEMPQEACGRCDFFGECPVRRVGGRYVLRHTAKQRRLAARRREQATEAFRDNYRTRAGIESTNGGLKRREGLGRVRARGQPRVFHRILMKICGWNILRAAAAEKIRKLVAKQMAEGVLGRHISAFFHLFAHILGRKLTILGTLGAHGRRSGRHCQRPELTCRLTPDF
jgi:hypothetical protein